MNKNKWKNFLLKIKFFFKKPDALKLLKVYSKKTIDTKNYETTSVNHGKFWTKEGRSSKRQAPPPPAPRIIKEK